MPAEPMVCVSRRMSRAMDRELRALAAEASAATGRRVTRSDVERQILADGIARARTAHRYIARYAGPPAATQEGRR